MGSNYSKKSETVENDQLAKDSQRLAELIEEIAQSEAQVA
jgi:hypothetical protein